LADVFQLEFASSPVEIDLRNSSLKGSENKTSLKLASSQNATKLST
jgi:hypothetical protein